MADEKSMPKNYVCTVNDAQRMQIENYCREHGWQFLTQMVIWQALFHRDQI